MNWKQIKPFSQNDIQNQWNALCLSLVSDALSPNRKTSFPLSKIIGRIEWEINVFKNDGKSLQKIIDIWMSKHSKYKRNV